MPTVPPFRVVTWNVGGAKFLDLPEAPTPSSTHTRSDFRHRLHDALIRLMHDFEPHVLLLQEIVQYGSSSKPEDLIDIARIPGYHYDPTIAIDTVNQSHPQKWQKYFADGKWPAHTYLAQGYGIIWREGLKHAAIWDFDGRSGAKIEKEIIRVETGLFTGSRDTEPRIAVVAHFIIEFEKKPLDIFIVNIHLTTLNGEREGSPSKDIAAARVRHQQLEVIANGIVSRYNEWAEEKRKKDKSTRLPALWVLGGDFNCMPSSQEIAGLAQMNFIDLNPHKGAGTKGTTVPVGTATITLDYLFAGPAFYSIDPYLAKRATDANLLPLIQYSVSDHFPVLADVPIIPIQ